MIKHDQLPSKNNLRKSLQASGAVALASLVLAPTSARALPTTGGTEAAPLVTEEGGVQAVSPETASQTLTPEQMEVNDEAQQDANNLAKLASKAKGHKGPVYPFPGVDGMMGLQTITASAPIEKSHKQGERQFQIIAALIPGTDSLDLDRVNQVVFTSGITNKKGEIISPYVQDSLQVNPRTRAFQASVLCKPFGGGTPEPKLADVIPITPDSQTLTGDALTATYTQMKDMVTAANHNQAITYQMLPFNGPNTTNDPAS